MSNYLYLGLMYFGLLFLLIGTIGIFRFQDVYLRLQAATKCLTFGFSFLIFGGAMMSGHPDIIAKALVAIVFQFLTAPISAHMIARSALIRGIRPMKTQDQGTAWTGELKESTNLE